MYEELKTTVLGLIEKNQLVSGGLVLGLITTIFYSLKTLPARLWGRIERKLLFTVTVEQGSELYGYIQTWIQTNHSKKLRSVRASYLRRIDEKENHSNNSEVISDPQNLNAEGETRVFNRIAYGHHADAFNFWYKKRLIYISSADEKVERAQHISSLFFRRFIIRGLFSKNAIKAMLEECVSYSIVNEMRRENPYIFKNNSYREWNRYDTIELKSIDRVFIPEKIKTLLVNDITSFYSNYQFYKDRGISYRRGYCLYGDPGNGKSSLISALAKKFHKNLYILNLKTYADENSFEMSIREIKEGSIILIEDIDSYFNKRESMTHISYSCFINTLSGVDNKQDIILFFTTNLINTLDEALIRSGRIDMMIEILNPTIDQVNSYLSFFYCQKIELKSIRQMSMADVENVCIQNKFDADLAISILCEQKTNDLKVLVNA